MSTDKDHLPFGKRYGFANIEIPFQVNDIDQTLRTDLWNAFYIFIIKQYYKTESYNKSSYQNKHHLIWIHFFKKALDDFPNDFQFDNVVKKHIETAIWYRVYDFFEFVFASIENAKLYLYIDFEEYVNSRLRENNSAYTLLKNRFIPITNETEINELKQTQESAKKNGLTGVQEHLNSAIELLSQKPKADFRNSIKESISMVEVISRMITPAENTLGKALNKLDEHQKINNTLKLGFEKLYAYTNGKNGIRHALMDDENVDFEDAKFFLISCSAFTNYLIEKAKKEKLL